MLPNHRMHTYTHVRVHYVFKHNRSLTHHQSYTWL